MPYIYSLPPMTSFDGKGLFGYTFGPLQQKDLEIYYIDVEKGHDTFMVSKKITRIYYVLCGSGYFTIADHRYNVNPGMLVEVPPNLEYSYSGKMKLIAISKPRWFTGNDTHTKWNPDVVRGDFRSAADGGSWLTRLVRMRILGKSPTNLYLKINRRLWNSLPETVITRAPIRLYGDFLHKLARINDVRTQAFASFFLRNRPQLELIRRLVERHTKVDNTFKVAVLGCSIGAEAYSIAWRIRSARPDLKITVHAVDISRKAVEFGRGGAYSFTSEPTNTPLFERMTEAEIDELFNRDGDILTIQSWIKDAIDWHVGDVGEAEIVDALGCHDIVVANNFLCHMEPAAAEKCLANIARLVKPCGYLLVSGVDLDVRTKVAQKLGWEPLQELLEEIHQGDPTMKGFWPCHYGGLEPLNKRRRDWKLRYAAAFRLIPSGERVAEDVGSESVNLAISPAALMADNSASISMPVSSGHGGCG
jgi:chemotaxis methyl-accepting protein methylase/mannose-6-phosphate isomerase-like protein (cupin superfamily)